MSDTPHLPSSINAEDLERYAEVLTWALRTSRAEPIKNGDVIVVRFDYDAIRVAEALYSRLTDEHLNPVMRMLPTPLMQGEHFMNSSYGQLTFLEPGEEELAAHAAGYITVYAPRSLTHLAGVDPRTMHDERHAHSPVTSILERRRRTGRLGWTSCTWPTRAMADAANMKLPDYEEQFLRANWLNMPNPVTEWRRIQRQLDEISTWLDSLQMRALHVESENVDLRLAPGENRRFRAVTGTNIPSCEVFVSPDCRTVSGTFYADMPSLHLGRVVHGARLDFDSGIAMRAEALTGGQFLQQRLYADSGSRRVGEFSLTDKRFSRVDQFMAHTILDENFGGDFGNCHIALGAAIPSTFSGPQEILTPEMERELGFNSSEIHWDLVSTENRRVTATTPDGPVVIYEDGLFTM